MNPHGRLFRQGLPEIEQPVIVVYRRPIEARAVDLDDRADLVFMVVVDLAAVVVVSAFRWAVAD